MESSLWWPVVVVVSSLVVLVQAKIVDITRDIQTVVRAHNDERMDPSLRAANMREMIWDRGLQRMAEQWASQCVYERPPRSSHMHVGANLHYQHNYVRHHHSVHRLIKHSLNSWTRRKNNFVYSPHCGSACLYVQMIHADSDRVGCAMNTCSNLKTHRARVVQGTLFVCLYSPYANLQGSFPYITGSPCSRCRRGESCTGGYLCTRDGDDSPAEIIQPVTWPPTRPPTRRPTRPPPTARPTVQRDEMTQTERYSMLDANNKQRRQRGLPSLRWDSNYLQRFCNHVIRCNVDYPGPRHAYTNFHRLSQNERPSDAVYKWTRDSSIIPPRTAHKCRTAFDIEECNHYKNMMQEKLTSMACATMNCGWQSRQMVCIYDDQTDREYSNRNRDRAKALDRIRRLRRHRSRVG